MKLFKTLPKQIRRILIGEIIAVAMIFAILNPFKLDVLTAITNQEIITYHIKDLFINSISNKKNSEDVYLATGSYEKDLTGELYGVGEGKNIIMIQVESLQRMLVEKDYFGQEITPSINEIIRDPGTVYFDNIYQQVASGNTSDSEFAANNSMVGTTESFTYQLFENNYFKGLPWILKEKDYGAYVFHGYEKEFWNRENIYPKLGFDKFYSSEDFVSDNIKGIGGGSIVGISDRAFYKQCADYMEDMPEPFYSFVISLSSHNPFNLPESFKTLDLRTEEQNIVGNYFDSIAYADRCIGEFMENLKEKGIYENSIIIIYGDHFALPKADKAISNVVSKWIGREYEYTDMLGIPFMIHVPGEDINTTISKAGGQIDFLPTISYIMGIEELNTLYLGQNLFKAEEGFAPMPTNMIKGSFIKDDVVFEMSRDGVIGNSKVWDRITGERLNPDDYIEDYHRSKGMLELSDYYLYNDILRAAIEEGKTIEEIQAGTQSKGSKALQKEQKIIHLGRTDRASRKAMEKYLLENPDETIMVYSEELLTVLKTVMADNTGKIGKVGVIGIQKQVDEKQETIYQDLKNRIIPVVTNIKQYPYILDLGYETIAIMPDFKIYDQKDIQSIVEIYGPQALILSSSEIPFQFNKLMQGHVPIYGLAGNSLIGNASIAVLGAYGTAKIITKEELK